MQRRTSSFGKVVSGIRKDAVEGSKSAYKLASKNLWNGPDHSTGHFMRVLSTRNGASTSAMSGTIDEIEDQLWDRLSLSDFWQHLELCERASIPLPFRHRLRMLTQIPHWISSAGLVHMFKEQDTVGVLTNVRHHTAAPRHNELYAAAMYVFRLASSCCTQGNLPSLVVLLHSQPLEAL